MKKRLFDENDRYLAEGMQLEMKVANFVSQLVKDLIKEGYSIRDIEYVCHGAITDVCLSELL